MRICKDCGKDTDRLPGIHICLGNVTNKGNYSERQTLEPVNLCPTCGNIVEPEDPKGNGISLVYYCDECEKFI